MIKAYVTANFDRASNSFSHSLIIYPSNDSIQDGSSSLRNRPDLHVEVSKLFLSMMSLRLYSVNLG